MARAEKKQDVAVREPEKGLTTTITDAMLAELLADAGAGLSTASEDNLIPIILLLQDMNPEVKKRDPNYLEGAEAGMYMNRATKQLWAGDKAMSERTGKPMLEFQLCYIDKAIIEWVPRLEGGGFVARHSLVGDVAASMERIGGYQVRDPNDPNKSLWKSSDGTHDLIETRYHFGHIINDDNPQPAVLPFSSTGHTTARQWNTLASGFKSKVTDPRTGRTVLVTQPAWFRRYIVGSKARENKKGSFFVGTIADADVIENDDIRALGKALYDSAKAGTVTAGLEEQPGGGGGGNGASDEI